MLHLGFMKHRRRQPELMDQPGLDASEHRHALTGLERINRWSGSARLLWPAIRELARNVGARPLRLLDIATGAGDIPIRLWQRAQVAGVPMQIEACDCSPCALAHAQRKAHEQKAAVHFFPLRVLEDDWPGGFDVVTCSLFLHHLDEDAAIALLRRMSDASERLVLVNDLRRSALGYVLARVGTRLLSTSHVVHVDGPLSVAGAFSVDEARSLAAHAGLGGATVVRRWPCRFLLTWRKPS